MEHSYGEERVLHAHSSSRMHDLEEEMNHMKRNELNLRSENERTSIEVHRLESEREERALQNEEERQLRTDHEKLAQLCARTLGERWIANASDNTGNSEGVKEQTIRSLSETLSNSTCDVVGCERATLWLVQKVGGTSILQTWNNGIVVEHDGAAGVAGAAASTGRVINIQERASKDPRYDSQVDCFSGTTTRTTLCVPIHDDGSIGKSSHYEEGDDHSDHNDGCGGRGGRGTVVAVLQVSNKRGHDMDMRGKVHVTAHGSTVPSSPSSPVRRKDSSWKIRFNRNDVRLLSSIGKRIGPLCCAVVTSDGGQQAEAENRNTSQLLEAALVKLAQLEQQMKDASETTTHRDMHAENINAIATISATLMKSMHATEDSQSDGISSPGGSKLDAAAVLIQLLFDLTSTQASRLTQSVRATLFILDESDDPDTEEDESATLWSYIKGGTMITIPASAGICGSCVTMGESITVDDCQNDPRFGAFKSLFFSRSKMKVKATVLFCFHFHLSSFFQFLIYFVFLIPNCSILSGGDKTDNFVTHAILCCPVHDNDGNIYGCLQVINKVHDSGDDTQWFTSQDRNVLADFAVNVGPVVKSWMAFFDIKNSLERQLGEAVSGERKMAELIAFLLQVGGTSLREAIGEDLAIELLSHAADTQATPPDHETGHDYE